MEELELHWNSAVELWYAWRNNDAPAVLPALQRIRMVNPDRRPPEVDEITDEELLRRVQGSSRQIMGSGMA